MAKKTEVPIQPKILLLDDDYISNELNKLVFSMLGIQEIDVMTSGQEALHYLEECSHNNEFPALMFVDINLSGMNGFSFVKEYEENYMNYSPETRIIILSNSIMEEDRSESLEFKSVLDFMSKPLTKIKLKEVFQRVNVEI